MAGIACGILCAAFPLANLRRPFISAGHNGVDPKEDLYLEKRNSPRSLSPLCGDCGEYPASDNPIDGSAFRDNAPPFALTACAQCVDIFGAFPYPRVAETLNTLATPFRVEFSLRSPFYKSHDFLAFPIIPRRPSL
jgi:hypothetical protein